MEPEDTAPRNEVYLASRKPGNAIPKYQGAFDRSLGSRCSPRYLAVLRAWVCPDEESTVPPQCRLRLAYLLLPVTSWISAHTAAWLAVQCVR